MAWAQEFGDWGEAEAARYLKGQGIRIVARHFQTRWGEIDLIGRHRDTWVFVEVKSRTRRSEPSAADALTPGKQKRLVNAALSFMKKHRLEGCNMRFDVILVEAGRVEWIPGAFELSSFYFF